MEIPFSELGEADLPPIVIVGSGPAGITLSMRLAELGVPSLILEAGGRDFDPDSQDFYIGESVGDMYFPLDSTRLRFFGGSSNHWANWCRHLEPHDFLPRDGIPHTGWPIRKRDLDPHLQRASEICGVSLLQQRALNADLQEVEFAVKSAPTNFAEEYGEGFETSDRSHFTLNAAVQSLSVSGGEVRSLDVAGPGGARLTLSPRHVVVACGGIENSRLLLWSNEVSPEPVVGEPAPLGRYWMEHPHYDVGYSDFPRRFTRWDIDQTQLAVVSPSYDAMQRYGVMNAGIRIKPLRPDTLLGNAASRLGCSQKRYSGETHCYKDITMAWEQAPAPENAIALSTDKTDPLGVPQTVHRWVKNDLDYRTALTALELLGRFVADEGHGRVRVFDEVRELGPFEGGEIGGHHHMGGTRMAANPRQGVVDANLKIHGLGNAYVAGSSVFPTGGQANPTLTIVQLSLRLADHLAASV